MRFLQDEAHQAVIGWATQMVYKTCWCLVAIDSLMIIQCNTGTTHNPTAGVEDSVSYQLPAHKWCILITCCSTVT